MHSALRVFNFLAGDPQQGHGLSLPVEGCTISASDVESVLGDVFCLCLTEFTVMLPRTVLLVLRDLVESGMIGEFSSWTMCGWAWLVTLWVWLTDMKLFQDLETLRELQNKRGNKIHENYIVLYRPYVIL